MPKIHLKNNVIEYEFEFETKYLFIRGHSGIGKTSLLNLVTDYTEDPDAVICMGDSNIDVFHSERDFAAHGLIFFLDEANPILTKGNAASLFNSSDNYFVIISRSQKFNQFKYSLDSIAEMKTTGTYHWIELVYPRANHITEIADIIVCEDSKSGKEFLSKVWNLQQSHKNPNDFEADFGNILLTSADSKDKFISKLRKLKRSTKQTKYTIVYDRSGIGGSYEVQMEFIQFEGITIVSEIDWDSFESYILESEDYKIDVLEFPNKEDNATRLFKQHIDTSYNKTKLPLDMKLPVYWKVKDVKDILEQTILDGKQNSTNSPQIQQSNFFE